MHILDLVTQKDEQGEKYFSLTECSAFLLIVVPVAMGLHSYVSGHQWQYFSEFCFYTLGSAVSIKATKGGVNAVGNYYGSRSYQASAPSGEEGKGGRSY